MPFSITLLLLIFGLPSHHDGTVQCRLELQLISPSAETFQPVANRPDHSSDSAPVDYNPLRTSTPPADRTFDTSFTDATRAREIPLRFYLPAGDRPQPVVLFSHGLGGSRQGGVYLGKHWSARGYVVVMIQHPGSDESVWKEIPLRERMAAMKKAANGPNTVDRFRDVVAVLDQLAHWNREEGHELHGRLDLEHIGMSGHSFGAVTTQGVSGQSAPGLGQRFTDKRIDAAVLFSPSRPRQVSPERAFADVKIPWLLMTGTLDTSPINDTTVADRRAVYSALPPSIDKYELVLSGAHHSAFSDGRLRLRENRNPNHHRAILAISTAFWDVYLRKDEPARQWLQAESPRQIMESADQWQRHLAPQQTPLGPPSAIQ